MDLCSDVTFVPVIAPLSPSLFEAIYSSAQLLIGVSDEDPLAMFAEAVRQAFFGLILGLA
jgi:hypothetical protein